MKVCVKCKLAKPLVRRRQGFDMCAECAAKLACPCCNADPWVTEGHPTESGTYWVELRSAGRYLFFYYADYGGVEGWESDKPDRFGQRPDWSNRQSPLLRTFGPVSAYKKARYFDSSDDYEFYRKQDEADRLAADAGGSASGQCLT